MTSVLISETKGRRPALTPRHGAARSTDGFDPSGRSLGSNPSLNREPNGREHVGSADRNDIMESQKLAVDTIVYATGCDRAEVTAFIARQYLGGLKDAKRLTFKGDAILQEPAF